MNILFQLLLTFNATSLIWVVYFIKSHSTIDQIFWNIKLNQASAIAASIPNWMGYLFVICIPIIGTIISLKLARYLDSDELVKVDNAHPVIQEIELANNTFLPSYLGYFFVALSVPDFSTLIAIYGILFLFTYYSQSLYFNPLFLLFGYQFYYLKRVNNIRIFAITKQPFKDPSTIEFEDIKRINDYTFLDI